MLWPCGNSGSLHCYCALPQGPQPRGGAGQGLSTIDRGPNPVVPTQAQCPHQPTVQSWPPGVVLASSMAQLLTPAPTNLES